VSLRRSSFTFVALLVVLLLGIAVPVKTAMSTSRDVYSACKGTNLVGAFAHSSIYASAGIITIAITISELLPVGWRAIHRCYVYAPGANTTLRIGSTALKTLI
jgi:hypothetical protein